MLLAAIANSVTSNLPWYVWVYNKPVPGLGTYLTLDLRIIGVLILIELYFIAVRWLTRKVRDYKAYQQGYLDGISKNIKCKYGKEVGVDAVIFVDHDCSNCKHQFEDRNSWIK